ncbi:ankyrin repeat-containing domain protein, partial [Globomyces pollinis-pini]
MSFNDIEPIFHNYFSTMENNSSQREAESVRLDTVKSLCQRSDLEKLPQELIYQITGYLNLTDFLQFIQTSKSLSKSSFALRQLEDLFQNNSIFKKPELIRKYLKLIPFSFTIFHNVLIRSIERNHISIVEMLLSDSRVDPSASNNQAIRYAAHKGHLQVVKLLIADSRVDPSADNNDAICYAAHKGHLQVVELLIADSRVDPSGDSNQAIRFAAQKGHLRVVELLIADSRVDPSDGNNQAIRSAAKNGHLRVVELLLSDSRVDPSADDNSAIGYAAENGHLQVVELLIADSRVDPSADSN